MEQIVHVQGFFFLDLVECQLLYPMIRHGLPKVVKVLCQDVLHDLRVPGDNGRDDPSVAPPGVDPVLAEFLQPGLVQQLLAEVEGPGAEDPTGLHHRDAQLLQAPVVPGQVLHQPRQEEHHRAQDDGGGEGHSVSLLNRQE